MRQTLLDYYSLAKPGIVRGNILVALAGFLLAADGSVGFAPLCALVIGLSLVIASACACNNVIDRRLDRKMQRTRQRAIVAGRISPRQGWIFAALTGLIGLSVLASGTTLLASGLAAVGHVAYVLIYGYVKRRSVYGTLAGTISGALPPVIGYTAVSGRLDVTAALLFAILVVWQMPHFYAIAIFRLNDYKAAGLPVLPVVRDIAATRLQMIAYIAAFIIISPLLTAVGTTGLTYAIVIVLLGMTWFWHGLAGFATKNHDQWARRMFRHSLVILICFSVLLALEPILP